MELREQLEARIFLYAEQPYAAGRLLGAREWGTRAEGALAVTRDVMRFGLKLASGATPMQASVTLAGQTLEDVRWCAVRTSRVDRGAKQRAIRSYASQLEPLGIRAMLGARVYEAARRGETLAAVSSTAPG
jgi:hypothetical protein